jgi:hypothetical protein
MPPTSLPLAPEARTEVVRVVVTPAEKQRLASLAASQGRSMSEVVRLALPLSEHPATPPTSNPFGVPDQVTFTRAA